MEAVCGVEIVKSPFAFLHTAHVLQNNVGVPAPGRITAQSVKQRQRSGQQLSGIDLAQLLGGGLCPVYARRKSGAVPLDSGANANVFGGNTVLLGLCPVFSGLSRQFGRQFFPL
jgi:hypothetical protein